MNIPANLDIDPRLLDEAKTLSGLKTERETVNFALSEFIRMRKVEKLIAMFGTVDYDPDYDYKKFRRYKRGATQP